MGNKTSVKNNLKKWHIDYNNIDNQLRIKNEFKLKHLNSNIVKNVQIEITNRCNFSCIMCPLDDIKNEEKQSDMSLDTFQSIIDKLPKSVKKINLQGLGESYLHKDFIKMLQYAKEKGLYTWNVNNGSLFTTNSLLHLDEIWFSLDSVISSELEEIRKNINTDQIFTTIKDAIKFIYNNNLLVKVNIYTAVNHKNWKNIKYLYEFCNEVGINELHINPTVNNYTYGTSKHTNMEKFIIDNQVIDWSLFSDKYSLKEYNFDLTVWYPRREMKGLCIWGFDTIYIDKNANIISCCRQVTTPLIFGNLKNDTFVNIYNGQKMNKFRNAHLLNETLNICDTCSMGVPL